MFGTTASGSGGRRRVTTVARCALGLVLALTAASCAGGPTPGSQAVAVVNPTQTSTEPRPSLDTDVYRLGAGDKVKVTVFGHPDESGEFVVDNEGKLPYSPIGRLKAQGLTVNEVQEELRTELDRLLIVNPRVSAEVVNYRPFYIYGEVQRGGSYPYVSGLTVRRAIAIAGGFTRRARQDPVVVLREGRDQTVNRLAAELDVPVFPGDVIEVERRLF